VNFQRPLKEIKIDAVTSKKNFDPTLWNFNLLYYKKKYSTQSSFS